MRNALRLRPWTVLAAGLLVAVTTAVIPLLNGNSILEHASIEFELPLIGTIKTTSALPFDIGVYLVVVGLVLMAYEAFGDDVAPDDESGEASSDQPVAVTS